MGKCFKLFFLRITMLQFVRLLCDHSKIVQILNCLNHVLLKEVFKKKKKKRNFHDKIIIVKLSGYTCVCLSTSFLFFWNFNPDINYSHIGIQVIGIKDHKFKQLQKGVDLSFYEVLIHKHTVRKDKGTKDKKWLWKKSRNH